MEFTEFWTICSSNQITLDLEAIDILKRYVEELKYWNEKVNMISRKDEDNILKYHILHCLSIYKYVDVPRRAQCLDIGTGGGLPGIPIAIAGREVRMTMVDSIAKKIKMTSMFAQHTGIKGLEAITTRVEALASEKRNLKRFDCIFARAVTQTVDLMNWSVDLIKPNGKYVLLKGGDLTAEIATAKEAYPGCKFQEINIDLVGAPWFKEEEKKILIITQ